MFIFIFNNLRVLVRFLCVMGVRPVGGDGKEHTLKIPWDFWEIVIRVWDWPLCFWSLFLPSKSECHISHPFSSPLSQRWLLPQWVAGKRTLRGCERLGRPKAQNLSGSSYGPVPLWINLINSLFSVYTYGYLDTIYGKDSNQGGIVNPFIRPQGGEWGSTGTRCVTGHIWDVSD